jgi:hypothetical protein
LKTIIPINISELVFIKLSGFATGCNIYMASVQWEEWKKGK